MRSARIVSAADGAPSPWSAVAAATAFNAPIGSLYAFSVLLQPLENLLSLSRAFLHAGARQVLSTLWEVGDRASLDLMVAFYDALAAGMPVAESLAAARRHLIAASAPPRAWAGFILWGAPG